MASPPDDDENANYLSSYLRQSGVPEEAGGATDDDLRSDLMGSDAPGGEDGGDRSLDDAASFGFASTTSSITRQSGDVEGGRREESKTDEEGGNGNNGKEDFSETDHKSRATGMYSTGTSASRASKAGSSQHKDDVSLAPSEAGYGKGMFSGPNATRNKIALAAVFLAIIGIVVGVAVGVTGKDKDDAPSSPNTQTESEPQPPTVPPTPAPSSSPSAQPKPTAAPVVVRDVALDELFASISGEAASTPGTPQYSAAEWMKNDDPLQLFPASSSASRRDDRSLYEASEDRIVQRYSLATLYYATGGPTDWISSQNWMMTEECGNSVGEGMWEFLACTDEDRVRAIAIDNNGLNGNVPPEIKTFLALENLILKNDPLLVGSIPDDAFLGLTELRQVGIYSSDSDRKGGITGPLPSSLYKATNLRYINFQNNAMTDHIRPKVKDLVNLQKLILFNNEFEQNVKWLDLGFATGLTYLGLSGNKLTGTISQNVGLLSKLEYLYLDDNDMGGTLPHDLGDLTSLKSINLDRNNFNGTFPHKIKQLTTVEFFSAADNDLSGELPKVMCHMTSLKTLNLAQNDLTGPIHEELGNMTSLENLYLFENKLNGTLPASVLESWEKLEVLFLSSNQLSGELPVEIVGANDTLRELYLSDNRFTGPIPEEICELSQLKTLFLDTNNFTDAIPSCLGNVPDLEWLYLFNNRLNGTVPSEIGQLLKLRGLGLEDNLLSGTVHSSICDLTTDPLGDLWADCGGDTPEVNCTCCTTCCPGGDGC